jgi:hypothetical protein
MMAGYTSRASLRRQFSVPGLSYLPGFAQGAVYPDFDKMRRRGVLQSQCRIAALWPHLHGAGQGLVLPVDHNG